MGPAECTPWGLGGPHHEQGQEIVNLHFEELYSAALLRGERGAGRREAWRDSDAARAWARVALERMLAGQGLRRTETANAEAFAAALVTGQRRPHDDDGAGADRGQPRARAE